ncbi:MAG: hypothetical protein PHN84_06395 [Desulfuromonadaceae bacterium]|nr:hypothetical protein [Desulfuromonadaceae bacterium]MDD2855390.1 hypothetical protein [Desulfuromonadaceae bacterium]
MCTNWKRFTFKAIILASLSLFLYGCGSGGESAAVPTYKEVNGIVYDSTGVQPFANAEVTAYAVDGTSVGKMAIESDALAKPVLNKTVGKVSTVPLSPTVRSNGQGKFTVKIPIFYSGEIIFVAKVRSAADAVVTFRAVLSSVEEGDFVVIGPASEIVYQYIVTNKGSSFTPENIQKAILALEPFLGVNFTQIPPLAIGSVPTPAQQQLLIVTQSINSLMEPGTTLADLVRFSNGTTQISLGSGQLFEELKVKLTDNNTALINQGVVISGSYTPPEASPVIQEPALSDTVPPSAPQNLTATSTPDTVTLTWEASIDSGGSGMAYYYIYRNDVFIKAIAAGQGFAFEDKSLAALTAYKYEVKARDASGNLSTGIKMTISTTAYPTYTVSGRITLNGAGLSSIYVVIDGAGTGLFVTGSDGYFNIPGVREGEYTVTPTSALYKFTPLSRSTTVSNSNIAGLDFVAAPFNQGSVDGEFTYPPGTIVGGISYPSGLVIGGVTYPTATVIGGVTYPTGTVMGGISYPNGVVIGGVAYPKGTIVGGVAFPVGAVVAGVTFPNGTVIGGVSYPSGTVIGTVTYPDGTVIGTVTYPNGAIIGGVAYPAGTVVAGVSFPLDTIITGVSYPNGVIIGGVTYPKGTVIGTVTYADGTVVGTVAYPDGTVIGSVTFPNGTAVGNITYPSGSLTSDLSFNQWNRISGNVTLDGVAVSGVFVTFIKGSIEYHVTTTDSNGNFSVPVETGSYTVIPSLPAVITATEQIDYTFDPVSKVVDIITEGTFITGQDFAATSTVTPLP